MGVKGGGWVEDWVKEVKNRGLGFTYPFDCNDGLVDGVWETEVH